MVDAVQAISGLISQFDFVIDPSFRGKREDLIEFSHGIFDWPTDKNLSEVRACGGEEGITGLGMKFDNYTFELGSNSKDGVSLSCKTWQINECIIAASVDGVSAVSSIMFEYR